MINRMKKKMILIELLGHNLKMFVFHSFDPKIKILSKTVYKHYMDR